MNIIEVAADIIKTWDECGSLDTQLVERLRLALDDETSAREEPAATGYMRDAQHDARERVARWGRRSADGKLRFVRGMDNELSFYVFNGRRWVAVVIDEDGDARVNWSDRENHAFITEPASMDVLIQMYQRLRLHTE